MKNLMLIPMLAVATAVTAEIKPLTIGQSIPHVSLAAADGKDFDLQAAAKAFGIAFEVDKPMLEKLASYNIDIEDASGENHHLLPVPSVFLVGTDGIIDFVYANPDYTTRIDSEVLLSAARAAVKTDE